MKDAQSNHRMTSIRQATSNHFPTSSILFPDIIVPWCKCTSTGTWTLLLTKKSFVIDKTLRLNPRDENGRRPTSDNSCSLMWTLTSWDRLTSACPRLPMHLHGSHLTSVTTSPLYPSPQNATLSEDTRSCAAIQYVLPLVSKTHTAAPWSSHAQASQT